MKLGYMTSCFGEWLLVSKDPFPGEKSKSSFVSLRPGPSLEYILPLLAEIGYKEVTICTWIGQEAFPVGMADRTEQRISRLVGDLGLSITALGSHGGSNHTFDRHGYLTRDKDEYAARLRYTKLCIDLAVRWGVPVVEDMVGQVPEGMEEHEAWARARDAFQELTDYAAKRGICLAIELFFGLVESPDAFVKLRREVDSQGLGCVLDMHNLISAGYPDVDEAINKVGPYVAHAHTKGVTKDGMTVPSGPDDIFDNVHYVKRLIGAAYKGPLTLEEYPDRYSPPMETPVSARLAYNHVSRLLGEAGL